MDDLALTDDAVFGALLNNDHPISVSMDTANEMNEVSGITTLTFYAGTGPNQVECASCHDPHGDGADYFLRIPSASGGLCETCHNK
jgi:predicted CXXCH cytochrome family protein